MDRWMDARQRPVSFSGARAAGVMTHSKPYVLWNLSQTCPSDLESSHSLDSGPGCEGRYWLVAVAVAVVGGQSMK